MPWKYDEIHEKHGWSLFKYFLLLVLAGFLVCLILFLPTVYSSVNGQMDYFKEFTVNVNTTMSRPVYLPYGNPLMVVDTRDKHVKPAGEYLLLTEDDFYVKKPFFMGTQKIDSSDFKDLTDNKGLVTFLILLMLPSLLLMFYVYYLIKTFLVLVLATIIGLVVTRLVKFDITFADLWKVGLLAVTPMVIIDFLRFPFGLFIFWAQYIVFILFFIFGIVKAGDFQTETYKPKKKSRKIKRKRGGGALSLDDD